ncbi:MAG: prolipoprotein diacylglyceryl transferase [Bacillota bacterium]
MPEIWFPNLGIEIQHLNRVAITLFGMDIYWYGVFIGCGVLSALFLIMHIAKKTGQNPDQYLDVVMYALVLGIIGARIYYVAFSWENYQDDFMKIFALREGGIAIYGGVIGGVLAFYLYSKWKKLDFLTMTDTAAPGLILAQAMGRWGNFVNREAFGDYTESFFAMRYQLEQIRLSDASAETLANVLTVNDVAYIQVHPTFLYESVWNLGVFALLIFFTRKKKFNGQITALYFLTYGMGRIWIEGLRTDQLQWNGVAVSQILSGILIVCAAAFLMIQNKKSTCTVTVVADEAEAVADRTVADGAVAVADVAVADVAVVDETSTDEKPNLK